MKKSITLYFLVLLIIFVFISPVYAEFCSKCGEKNRDEAKFCSKCGTATTSNNVKDTNKIIAETIPLNKQLIDAASEGDLFKFKQLAEKGADLNAVNDKYFDSLYLVCINGNLDILNFLIDKGINVKEGRGSRGVTPLQIAAFNGKVNIMKRLIEKGADINAKDVREFTPLYDAINANSIDAVKILIENKVNLKDIICDKTIVEIARENNCSEQLIKILIDAGAPVSNSLNKEFNLTGLINNKLKLKMSLAINENSGNITGTYIYEKYPKDIMVLNGSISNSQITLYESIQNKNTGVFKGQLLNNSFFGIWSDMNNKKNLKFELKVCE